MRVSEEQCERDIEDYLESLGYATANLYQNKYKEYNLLVTRIQENECYAKNIHVSHAETKLHYFIKEYNPALFLAIAAMTEGNDFIVGEYAVHQPKNEWPCLVQIQEVLPNEYIVSCDAVSSPVLRKHLRKPSLEFLVEELSPKRDESILDPERHSLPEDEFEKDVKLGVPASQSLQFDPEKFLPENASMEKPWELRPQYYRGKDDPYEPIKVIRAWDLGFELGNAVKYIGRAGIKTEDPTEDIKKAITYLKMYLER